jgi:hypothetical protein
MAVGHKTGGREKGTPNKTTKALKDMILGALSEAGGQQYLARMAEEQPSAFLMLLGKVLPTTIRGDTGNPVQTVTRIEIVPVKPQLRGDLW